MLHKMFKIFALVVSIFSVSLFQEAHAVKKEKSKMHLLSHKAITLSELHLYKILLNVKTNIDRLIGDVVATEHNQENVELKAFFTARDLTQEALVLFEQIVNDLNDACFSYNPELEYRFVKMCNHLRDVKFDDIKPRHIRSLEKEVKKFNQYITLYCISRKDFLAKEDLALFNKLSKFNQILILALLRDDYFDIGLMATLSDWFVHQPMEFAADHPVLTTVIAAAFIGGAGYLIYNNYFKRRNPYAVKKLCGLQQNAAECGVYSALHAVIVSSSPTEDAARQALERLRQHPKVVNELRDAAIAQRAAAGEDQPVDANWLRHDEIQQLIGAQGPAQHIRGYLGLAPLGIPPVVIQNPEWLRLGNNELTDEVCQSVQNLRQHGQPQTAVLYLGRSEQDARGHWVAVHMVPDAGSYGGIRAWVVNSFGGDLSDNIHVERLLDVYRQGAAIPVPDVLLAITHIQDADSLLNDDVRGGLQDKAHNSFDRLAQGCRLIQQYQPALLQDAWCQNMYQQIQQQWLVKGIERVMLGRQRITLADCPTLDQFVAQVCLNRVGCS